MTHPKVSFDGHHNVTQDGKPVERWPTYCQDRIDAEVRDQRFMTAAWIVVCGLVVCQVAVTAWCISYFW